MIIEKINNIILAFNHNKLRVRPYTYYPMIEKWKFEIEEGCSSPRFLSNLEAINEFDFTFVRPKYQSPCTFVTSIHSLIDQEDTTECLLSPAQYIRDYVKWKIDEKNKGHLG